MTAFVIATSTIKDVDKFQLYGQKAGSIITTYGGKVVKRGKHQDGITQNLSQAHQFIGIISFPSIEDINKCFESEDYQALIPLREDAAEMIITTYSAIE